MASRLIAQLLVGAAQVVVRAFGQAYREAAANAARGGAKQGANNARQGAKGAADKARQAAGAMSIAEARQILNVEKEADWNKVLENYHHLFKTNDKNVGGSFYLQSKVFRAKEALETEYDEEARQAAEEAWEASIKMAEEAKAKAEAEAAAAKEAREGKDAKDSKGKDKDE